MAMDGVPLRSQSTARAVFTLLYCTVMLAATRPLLGAEPSSGPGQPPNIVFLLADDQCTYSLGCYGTPGVQTPQLDRLARDGLVFDRYYATTAICMASRATTMTGLLEYRTGCNFSRGPLLQHDWQRSYPILLRQAGYQTAFAGKFGFLVASGPQDQGRLPRDDFDTWGGGPGQTYYETARNPSIAQYAEEYPHSTRAYGAFGRDFIHQAAASGAPFCLSISFKAPHRPVQPDPRYDELYRRASFTKPGNFGREHGIHFAPQSRQGRQWPRFIEWGYRDHYDEVMAKYYQQIYAIDVAVGMIREALEKTGAAENTVIIYTSDNGFLCGSHGYGSKVLPYEESSRVPLIIYDPRAKETAGRRCGALAGNVDLAPTIMDLAGVGLPTSLDGRSLTPLLADLEQEVHEYLPLINVWGPQATHSFSLVTHQWKYIYWPYNEGAFEPVEELYNLAADPLELTNLASDAKSWEELESMRRRYNAAVAHWRQHATPHHGYQQYGDWFQRP